MTIQINIARMISFFAYLSCFFPESYKSNSYWISILPVPCFEGFYGIY